MQTTAEKQRQQLGLAEQPDMLTLIEQAKREWHSSANYFNNVSDPELVDHAIMVRQAAEQKYMYLLKQAKRQGVVAWIPQSLDSPELTGTNEPA